MAPHHFTLLVGICLIWGFNFIAGKVGVEHFPPLFFTALRFVFLSVLLAAFLRLHEGRMRHIVSIGIFAGSLHFGLIFTGLAIADVSVAAIVTQLNVPFVTILSVLLLGERIGWKRALGIGLAISGIMVISFDPAVFDQGAGIIMMGGAALSIAFAMVQMRRLQGVNPMEMQAWIAILSWPPLLAASFLLETGQWEAARTATGLDWATVAYTTIGASLIGHGGMYFLLQRYEASLTGPLTTMAPVFSIFFGVTLLGEPVTGRMLIGGGMTILGVIIIAVREGAKGRAAATSDGAALAGSDLPVLGEDDPEPGTARPKP